MPKKYGVNINNGILRLYNQFPRDYYSIAEMVEYLPNIANMGFNVVWINPIQKTGGMENFSVGWLGNSVQYGSLYAMSSSDAGIFYIQGTEDDLREYTSVAIDHGLTPLFDLVLNHVAADSSLCSKHENWFKSYNPRSPFRDCREFNYDDASVRPQIMGFWKEYIDRYILVYGFMGARIDAIKHIPANVQKDIYSYVEQAYLNKFGADTKPVVFAELLLSPQEWERLPELQKEYRDCGISHICISHVTGNAYWDLSTAQTSRKKIGEHLANMREKSHIGAVVEFTGSHDQRTLFGKIIEEKSTQLVSSSGGHISQDEFLKHRTQQMALFLVNAQRYDALLESLMKKKIALVAFMSNGGYYLLGGDEFGDPGMHDDFISDSRKCTKLVFNSHITEASFIQRMKRGDRSTYDLRAFTQNVNAALGLLFEPQIGDWMEYIDLSNYPDLLVIIRHGGMGYGGSKQLIVANISAGRDRVVQLTDIVIREIIEKRGDERNQGSPLQSMQQILILGNVKVECNLGVQPNCINSEVASAEAAAPSTQAHHTLTKTTVAIMQELGPPVTPALPPSPAGPPLAAAASSLLPLQPASATSECRQQSATATVRKLNIQRRGQAAAAVPLTGTSAPPPPDQPSTIQPSL